MNLKKIIETKKKPLKVLSLKTYKEVSRPPPKKHKIYAKYVLQ
jgi:hypothetical protein